jgi:uncharacterized membrane protein (DUF2068 family)
VADAVCDDGTPESSGTAAGSAAHAQSCPPAACDEAEGSQRRRHRGLLLIGVFKLLKALFFLAVGVGALHLIHKNLADLLMRVTTALHFSPEWRLVQFLQDRADLVSGHELRQVSGLSIGYAVVASIEATGLLMEKTWGEYLTLTLTVLALPWEMWEMHKHFSDVKLAIFVINIAVVGYLLWLIRRMRTRQG